MKQYMAFCGDVYYPSGGMGDFVGDFDELEEAKAALEVKDDDGLPGYRWWHVYDTVKREQVFSSE